MNKQRFCRTDAPPPSCTVALPRNSAFFLSLLVLSLCLPAAMSLAQPAKFRSVTIQNTVPRRDVDGNVIDAHDGCLHFYAGRYYLYGTAYGKTAGYTINNRFRVYSSADLERWTYEGELLKSPPDGVYYRPYVAYNQRTRKYVLWYNWYRKLWDGEVGVATSDTPVGPFTIVNTHVELSQAKDHPGDGSLFVARCFCSSASDTKGTPASSVVLAWATTSAGTAGLGRHAGDERGAEAPDEYRPHQGGPQRGPEVGERVLQSADLGAHGVRERPRRSPRRAGRREHADAEPDEGHGGG